MSSRREFLRRCLRNTGLLSLGGLAIGLGANALRREECHKLNPCGGCPQFKGCDLPRAARAKDAAKDNPPAHA